jgi:hypothetical protein
LYSHSIVSQHYATFAFKQKFHCLISEGRKMLENTFRITEFALVTYRKSSVESFTAKKLKIFRGNAKIKTVFFFTQFRSSCGKNFKSDFVSEVCALHKILLVYSVSN